MSEASQYRVPAPGSTASIPGPGASNDLALPEGHLVGGRYRIVSWLGAGGFAHVYRAEDTLLHRELALKVLRSHRVSEAALARFRREVRLGQQIADPHVVHLYEIGEAVEGMYLTMELIEGETLRERIAAGPLPIEEALGIARQVLRGLAALHRAGVVHRDVKPSNILIGHSGAVKLADLGLARGSEESDTRATATDAVIGTWEYLAPEQALGKSSDARTDLYSFGVVLYEVLTGELPFGERGALASAIAHVHRRAPSVREKRREVPRWLDRLVTRLLEKSPTARIQSAEDVIRILEQRRTPLGARGIMVIGSVMLLAVLAAAAALLFERMHTAGETSVFIGPGGAIESRDGRGRTLWSKKGFAPDFVAQISMGGRRAVALIHRFDRPAPYSPRFLIVDAETGASLLDRPAPPPTNAFADFDPFAFRPAQLLTTDRDQDGWDEVVLVLHHTYYPCYIVALDTRTGAVQTLMGSSGHQFVNARADVTGDGRADLILSGTNNRLGYYGTMAAIDIHKAFESHWESFSPDRTDNPFVAPALYALLPHSWWGHQVTIEVDAASRQFRLLRFGSEIRLDFDGFPVGTRSALTAHERRAARARAYRELVRAEAALDAGDAATALQLLDEGAAAAQRAGDALLAEACARLKLRPLAASGDWRRTVRHGEQLGASTNSAITLDLARALHLHGHRLEAVPWYRKGIAISDYTGGRLPYEFVEGAVLALVREQRFQQAQALLDGPAKQIVRPQDAGIKDLLEAYRVFLRWRAGSLQDSDQIAPRPMEFDLCRYWSLELRYAREGASAQLLEAVKTEERRNSVILGGVLSLRAQLLSDLERHAEARTAAAQAGEWATAWEKRTVEANAHADLIRARAERVGRPGIPGR